MCQSSSSAPAQCPLYRRKRTWLSALVMSALCQKRTRSAARSIGYNSKTFLYQQPIVIPDLNCPSPCRRIGKITERPTCK
jgi:hypothetical protein